MSSERQGPAVPPWLVLSLLGLALGGLLWWRPDPGAPLRAKAEAGRSALVEAMSPVPTVPTAVGNRWADEPAAAELGQALFYDKALSPNGEIACSTCHDPAKGFSDGKKTAVGMAVTSRNAPTLLGAQYSRWWFWDGRADSQWSQALGPVEAAAEHGFSRAGLVRRVLTAHRQRYTAVFGQYPEQAIIDAIPAVASPSGDEAGRAAWAALTPELQATINRISTEAAKAIAAYQRKLLPGAAPIDRYVAARKAGDKRGGGHLSPEAVRGLNLFIGRAKCVMCHSGPLFSDQSFHNLGLASTRGLVPCKGEACGSEYGRTHGAREVLKAENRCGTVNSDEKTCRRLRHLNPEFEDFIGAFKTPTLRNVELTAPYMHDGEFETIDEVLGFYNTLPGEVSFGHRELFLRPLGLSADEVASLKAFLLSLTGEPLPAALTEELPPR